MYRDFQDEPFMREARRTRTTARRFVDYLKTRSSETWAFFLAGLIVGGILM